MLRFPFKNWRPPNGLCDLRPVENNGPKSRTYHGTVEHSGISAVRRDASSIPIFELFVESGAHDTRVKSGVGWRFKGGIDMERHAILLTMLPSTRLSDVHSRVATSKHSVDQYHKA
jgi:hypothetical protein